MRWYGYVLAGVLLPLGASAQHLRSWELGLAGGAAANLPTALRLSQRDAPTLRLRARYRTEPFRPPVYYDVRLATWRGNTGWALRLTHHKLILDTPPPEVQSFSMTDGFNLLTVSRLWRRHGWAWAVGAGAAVPHPESTVRGRVFRERGGLLNTGYFLAGPAVEVGVARRQPLGRHLVLQAEVRTTAAAVRVPIDNGHARATNVALHGLLGVAYQFGPAVGAASR